VAHGMIDLIQFAEGSSGPQWIQIMKTGEWQHPKLKQVRITQQDLAQFKDNFDRKVRGVDLAVDVSHNPDAGAVGWFKELKVDGDKLMAKVDWTEEGGALVKSGKYRYFSPEFMFSWTDPATKQEHKDVLLGGALTNRPFLKDMEPVAFSESGMGEVWMAENESMSHGKSDYAPSTPHPDGSNYDPDGDGDDDSTTDPRANPDWMADVKMGATKWPKHQGQQAQLIKSGVTKSKADAAWAKFQQVHPMPKATVQMDDGTGTDDEDDENPEDGSSTASNPDDTNAGQFTETKPKNGGGKMPGENENVVTLAEFQAAQQKIQLLESENRKVKMTEKVRSWMFDESTKTGKIAPAQHDKTVEMLLGMTDEQVAKFEEFMESAPAAISFGEHGTSADIVARLKEGGSGDKSEQVVKLAEKYERENNMEWKEAFIRASDELGVK